MFFSIGCSTETIVEEWNNGKVKILRYQINRSEEKEIHFYATGQKKEAGLIIDNHRNGQWVAWYGDGSLKSKTSYKQGNLFSNYSTFYKDGSIEQYGSYDENEKLEGSWLSYYVNGKIKLEGEYTSGQKTGVWKSYDSLGSLELKEEFFYNGCGKNQINYRNGVKHGNYLSWYLCDKQESSGYYNDGLKDSVWVSYWEFGDTMSTGIYEDGNKIGKWIEYYENGQVQSVKIHKDTITQLVDYWDNNGKKLVENGNGKIKTDIGSEKIRVEIYKKGILIESFEMKVK